jgi:hypothetical protein
MPSIFLGKACVTKNTRMTGGPVVAAGKWASPGDGAPLMVEGDTAHGPSWKRHEESS